MSVHSFPVSFHVKRAILFWYPNIPLLSLYILPSVHIHFWSHLDNPIVIWVISILLTWIRFRYSPTLCMLFEWSDAKEPKSLEHLALAPLKVSSSHINQRHFSATPKYPGGQCLLSKIKRAQENDNPSLKY
jgi:hypothetical protein